MAREPDPSTPAAVLGARIRARRLERGWSLEEFARRSGHHYTYLSRIELGKTNTRTDYLVELAFTLDINPATLVDGLLPRGRRRRRRRARPPAGDVPTTET